MVFGAAAAGAAAGVAASRLGLYRSTLDEDEGRIYRGVNRRAGKHAFLRKRRKPHRGLPRPRNRARGFGRMRGRQYRVKKSANGDRKVSMHKRKRPVVKFDKGITKTILYPNSFKIMNYVGKINNFNGDHGTDTVPSTQVGNMIFRKVEPSKDNNHSAWECWRLTALAKTTSSGTPTALLDIGTNHFPATTTEADIKSGANQSRCLTIVANKQDELQTLEHYTKCTGTPRHDINPNHLVSGFAIDLQFLSLRQCKQQLSVKLIRIKSQATEDVWGQSQPGSAVKTFDLVAGMVNSQRWVDSNEYEVLWSMKTILPPYSPGAAHPKITRCKKFLKCSYTMTKAKRTFTSSTSDYGAEFAPVQQRDNSYYNQVYLVYSARPLSDRVMATRTGMQSADGAGASNLEVIDSFPGAAAADALGLNTSARFAVNGTCTMHGRCQAVRRMNHSD